MVKSTAIFALGLTSPVLAHVFHIVWGLVIPAEGGSVMTGILASFPANLVAITVFVVALIVVWRVSVKEREAERRKQVSDKEERDKFSELMREIRDELRGLRGERTTKSK